MKKNKESINVIFVLMFMVISHCLFAQHHHKRDHEHVAGIVYEQPVDEAEEELVPLAGASVYWLGTTMGTITDSQGRFDIHPHDNLPHRLVISFVGFKNDTIFIEQDDAFVEVILQQSQDLDEVIVSARKPGAHVSGFEPIHTEVITSAEFQRAACCNLSEAFETSASIDVEYTDAVSGAQQIKLLGLAGTYSQLLNENFPMIRGLGEPFGLSYVPGPWMESIYISKGSASVVNGYESITGQINVELKKPETSEKLFYNLYVNDFGRLESSLNTSVDITDDFRTMVLLHGEYLNNPVDHNNNSFADHPLVQKINFMNRYRYDIHGVMESQFGVRVMKEDRSGGQVGYLNGGKNGIGHYYGFGSNTTRYELFAKTGFFLQNQPHGSIGTIFSYSHHDHQSYYGLNDYDGNQNTFYANIIYENIIRTTDHKINTGISYIYDDYDEMFNDSVFAREESVPGVFAEYTYSYLDRLTAIAGIRADFHNIYNTFITPRLHLRYNITESTTLRLSAGKGYRVPNLIAENTGLLVSARQIHVQEEIKPEEAWNYGATLTQNFDIFGNEATFSVEYFRTDFVNQLIVDIDNEPFTALFYNLDGKSYSNSYQAELAFEPLSRFEITVAYRHTDVKQTIGEELVRKPFVNLYRGLLAGSYATANNKWQFDLTAQFNGPGRIPELDENPEAFDFPDESPFYTILLGQVTYRFNRFDIYLGGDNLANYRQSNPIIASHDPFSENFDGSMIWGPVSGRMFYLGLKYELSNLQPPYQIK